MINKLYRIFLLAYTKCYTFITHSVNIGEGSVVYPTTRISNSCMERVKIGANCAIGRRKKGPIIGHFFPTRIIIKGSDASVHIGNNTNLNGVYIASRKSIEIGSNCRIAAGVVILDHKGHIVNSGDRTHGQDIPNPITIGDNVWLGTNCIILKGTVIGDNSVVSCGSVVKGVFEENSIIQGNPAKVVGKVQIDKTKIS